MAESLEPNAPSTSASPRTNDDEAEKHPAGPETDAANKMECPVCLQSCIHPARLPCGHIFCFLCVKGVAFKNRRCAMCRQDIPPDYLEHPQLVNGIKEVERTVAAAADVNEYQWYYEGRNGWWQYDERTSQELEEAYAKGEKFCKILVAGFLYIVYFEHKCQIRQNDPSRIRRVKRDLANIPKKGVAGLRLETNDLTSDGPTTSEESNAGDDARVDDAHDIGASTSTQSTTRSVEMRTHRNIVDDESLPDSSDEEEEDDDDDDDEDDEDDNGVVDELYLERLNLNEGDNETRLDSPNESNVDGADVELGATINNLNELHLSVRPSGNGVLLGRNQIFHDYWSPTFASDSDDDNEDNHVIL